MNNPGAAQKGVSFDFTKGGQGVGAPSGAFADIGVSDATVAQIIHDSPSIAGADWQTVYDTYGTVRPGAAPSAFTAMEGDDLDLTTPYDDPFARDRYAGISLDPSMISVSASWLDQLNAIADEYATAPSQAALPTVGPDPATVARYAQLNAWQQANHIAKAPDLNSGMGGLSLYYVDQTAQTLLTRQAWVDRHPLPTATPIDNPYVDLQHTLDRGIAKVGSVIMPNVMAYAQAGAPGGSWGTEALGFAQAAANTSMGMTSLMLPGVGVLEDLTGLHPHFTIAPGGLGGAAVFDGVMLGAGAIGADASVASAVRAPMSAQDMEVVAGSVDASRVPNSELTIAANGANGNPAAISRGLGELNSRQAAVLEQLPEFGSNTIVGKSFGQNDLAALTATTGDEFAMFSTGGRRLIYRGDFGGVPVTPELAEQLSSQGWRWSSHTHPGFDVGVLRSSPGDQAVLRAMGGNQSAIFNSMGQRGMFTPNGDSLNGWVPW